MPFPLIKDFLVVFRYEIVEVDHIVIQFCSITYFNTDGNENLKYIALLSVFLQYV